MLTSQYIDRRCIFLRMQCIIWDGCVTAFSLEPLFVFDRMADTKIPIRI